LEGGESKAIRFCLVYGLKIILFLFFIGPPPCFSKHRQEIFKYILAKSGEYQNDVGRKDNMSS
jgi:hypothetical protein